jgi:predicted RNase H-like HicB family nuclease
MHIHIEVEREEDGRWIAEVPDLPGVIVYGDDRASAVDRAQALAVRVLAERLEEGGEAYLRNRGDRGSRAAYDAALAEVPDVEPQAHDRLEDAAALLDPAEERALAEEGLAADFEAWPEYADGARDDLDGRSERGGQ